MHCSYYFHIRSSSATFLLVNLPRFCEAEELGIYSSVSINRKILFLHQSQIICIGSIDSFKRLLGLGHYVAAKHGVIGLVKTMAIELVFGQSAIDG